MKNLFAGSFILKTQISACQSARFRLSDKQACGDSGKRRRKQEDEVRMDGWKLCGQERLHSLYQVFQETFFHLFIFSIFILMLQVRLKCNLASRIFQLTPIDTGSKRQTHTNRRCGEDAAAGCVDLGSKCHKCHKNIVLTRHSGCRCFKFCRCVLHLSWVFFFA